jgi:hypothetical protein
MKLKSKTLLITILLSLFFSCSKKENTTYTFEDFRNDELLNVITKSASTVRESYSTNTSKILYNELDAIVVSAKKLNTKYGEEKVKHFLDLLVEEEKAIIKSRDIGIQGRTTEDKCHRRSNGTVDMDDCSFWETVVVSVVSAFDCVQPGSFATQAEINAYYDCVQSVVCRKC